MSTNNSSSSSSGIGFTGALTIAFIVLKLTHVIDWSWWWVLAPLWIGAAIVAVILLVILIVALVIKD
jgi:hypothetical protein